MNKRELLIENAWRLRVESYAAHMSKGAWLPYRWIVYVLRIVQPAIMAGNARIIINAPPRHGKSEATSHWLITWFLDWFPDRRVIFTSYDHTFASEFGLKVRDDFQYNPETLTKLRKDKSAIDNWRTDAGGGMTSLGTDGGFMGRGFDLGVIDDPYKTYQDAESSAKQKEVKNYFDRTFYNRAEPGGSMIINHTRWNDNDLTAHVLKEYPGEFTHIRLPALAELKDDPLGRTEGEPLCPERWPVDVLNKFKKKDPFNFAGLYQQSPRAEQGNIVNPNWFEVWDELPIMDEWIQSWDLNLEETTNGSYAVGQVWGRKGPDCYLVDQFRRRTDFPDTCNAVRMMAKKWPLSLTKIVEKKAIGPAVVAVLKKEMPGLIAVNPVGSKVSRLRSVSGIIQSGNVYIPNRLMCDWVDDYVMELTTFPNAANDDQVDTTSQALLKLNERNKVDDLSLGGAGVRPAPLDFV